MVRAGGVAGVVPPLGPEARWLLTLTLTLTLILTLTLPLILTFDLFLICRLRRS